MVPSRFALPTLALLHGSARRADAEHDPRFADSVAAADYARARASSANRRARSSTVRWARRSGWRTDASGTARAPARGWPSSSWTPRAGRVSHCSTRSGSPPRSRSASGSRYHRGDAADGDAGGGPGGSRGLVVRRARLVCVPARHVRVHTPRDPADTRAQPGRLARRQALGVHPRPQPLGARPRDRQGDAAHHRRRQGPRLRDRQRRLDRSDRPVLLWSPDSRKIATFQHDARGVGEMYLVTTNVGHPELDAWKYPLPGRQRDLPHRAA